MSTIATAVTGAVGALGSAGVQAYGAKKASKAMVEGGDAATQTLYDMYYQSREDQGLWRAAGEWALMELLGEPKYALSKPDVLSRYEESSQLPIGSLTTPIYKAMGETLGEGGQSFAPSHTGAGVLTDPSKYTESPSYNWLLTEGVEALDKSAASRGRLRSSAQEDRIMQFGQNLASTDYQNYLNNLFRLAGLGGSAASSMAATGTQYGSGIAQSHLYGGEARASGYINQANILGNLLSQGSEGAMLYGLLN